MYQPRIIPVLLLRKNGIVKSTRFKDHRYIGDPINAVRIFNDLQADELVFLDIDASRENRPVSTEIVRSVGEEANMPFAAGGGITRLDEIERIIATGAEKVILNSIAGKNPDFVKQAVNEFGSSTIVVCIDFKKTLFKNYQVVINNGKKGLGHSPVEYSRMMEDLGAGELIIQSVDRDGMMQGYDSAMIKEITESVKIPVTILGGAGSLNDIKLIYEKTVVNGFGAGSMFVYHGPRKAILINYPEKNLINNLLKEGSERFSNL